ncbi:MAG: ROK family protein [Melioribacteraceae bacterium]|nr:ROK family protein [Melioribacteraceae bacterium]MCF8356655.1 ROK family protein [Melioribacteraceae bacterium]MCF8393879.1 ROK family protein [Melioribacteraceae bacterium]MCF8419651.1 ROK family protein [Melioribacteraceae bacterium]
MDHNKTVLGIDIGGTNTVFGLVTESGEIVQKDKIKTNSSDNVDLFFERLFQKLNDLFDRYEVLGIGIGAPNANYYKTTIEYPPNLCWDYVDVKAHIRKYTELPCALTNDANAAALGEMLFGAAKGMKNFIEITLGTGLGSGIVVDGKLVYGHDGFAGEIGHVIVKENGRECGCGRKGCLETYASASGIRRTVAELIGSTITKSKLREMDFNKVSAEMIYQAAVDGDELANKAFQITGEILGKTLSNSMAYLSPEAIILFGGLANAGDLIFDPVKSYMEENMLNIFKNKVKVLPSGLPESDTAVLGSAALIWEELKMQNAEEVK